MATNECKAKNKATCRYHGVNLRDAKVVLTQTIGTNKFKSEDALKAISMLKNAENYNENQKATGMVVHYDDGSTEVFIGSATDPYHAADWSFNSDNGTLVEIEYAEYTRDNVEMGIKTVKSYQTYLQDNLVGAKPVFQEGEGRDASNKTILNVTVL